MVLVIVGFSLLLFVYIISQVGYSVNPFLYVEGRITEVNGNISEMVVTVEVARNFVGMRFKPRKHRLNGFRIFILAIDFIIVFVETLKIIDGQMDVSTDNKIIRISGDGVKDGDNLFDGHCFFPLSQFLYLLYHMRDLMSSPLLQFLQSFIITNSCVFVLYLDFFSANYNIAALRKADIVFSSEGLPIQFINQLFKHDAPVILSFKVFKRSNLYGVLNQFVFCLLRSHVDIKAIATACAFALLLNPGESSRDAVHHNAVNILPNVETDGVTFSGSKLLIVTAHPIQSVHISFRPFLTSFIVYIISHIILKCNTFFQFF